MQTRQFEQAFQLQLTPVALGFHVCCQGPGQVGGILVQSLVQFLQVTDLFLHHLMLDGFLLVRFFHRVAELGEFLAQRFEQGIHLFCVQFGEFFRAVLEYLSCQALKIF